MEDRRVEAIFLALGTMVAALFFVIVYFLATDANYLPALARAGNLNFDFDAGELIFGVLGGGAALWAARTFATWTRASKPPPETAPSMPPPPDAGGGDDAAGRSEHKLDEIISRLDAIERRLDGMRPPPPVSPPRSSASA